MKPIAYNWRKAEDRITALENDNERLKEKIVDLELQLCYDKENVEIVTRCKACKHKRVRQLDNKIFCWLNAREVKADDYCSRAERKKYGR